MSAERWIDPDLPGVTLADGKTYVRVRDVAKLWPAHRILKTVVKHMKHDRTYYAPITDDPDMLVACWSR